MIPTHIYISTAYISHPSMIFVKSTWGSMWLSSVISKFVVFSELFRQRTDAKQNIVSDSWKQMFMSFRDMVADLYKEWYQYLKHSLDSEEEAYSSQYCGCGKMDQQFEVTVQLSVQEIWVSSYGIH
jgi:hypothetical protein